MFHFLAHALVLYVPCYLSPFHWASYQYLLPCLISITQPLVKNELLNMLNLTGYTQGPSFRGTNQRLGMLLLRLLGSITCWLCRPSGQKLSLQLSSFPQRKILPRLKKLAAARVYYLVKAVKILEQSCFIFLHEHVIWILEQISTYSKKIIEVYTMHLVFFSGTGDKWDP